MSKLKFGLGGDHAGYELKGRVIGYLQNRGFEVTDFGPFSEDSVDYPDFVHPVAKSVSEGNSDFGILICGSGNGVCMTANKYQKVRAGLCWKPELAALTKQHNNANVLCIPARFIDGEEGLKIVEAFVNSEFEGGRHERRVNKISC